MKRYTHPAAAALFSLLVSLAVFTPRIGFWRWRAYPYVYFENSRVVPLLAQLRDPLHWNQGIAPAGTSDWQFRMANALQWRLLPPVLGRFLHLGPTAYFGMAWVALLLLLGVCVRQAGARGWLESLSIAVLVATSAGGLVSTWFVGYFDAGCLLALVVAALVPGPAALVLACGLGPWVDERCLLMLPAVLAIRWGLDKDRRMPVWAAAAVLPYLIVRLVAWRTGDSSVPSQLAMQAGRLPLYWRWLVPGWWEGFRAGWVLVVAGVILAGSRLRPAGRWFLGAALAGYIVAITVLAWDSTRNAAALLPFLVLGATSPRLRRLLPWLAAANLLLPAGIWVYDKHLPFASLLWR